MFVDEVTIDLIAGDGGNGCMAFRREKYILWLSDEYNETSFEFLL